MRVWEGAKGGGGQGGRGPMGEGAKGGGDGEEEVVVVGGCHLEVDSDADLCLLLSVRAFQNTYLLCACAHVCACVRGTGLVLASSSGPAGSAAPLARADKGLGFAPVH